MADDWVSVADAAPPADDWAPVAAAPSPVTAGGGRNILPLAAQVAPHVERVMEAFGHGFREGFGPDKLGLSDESAKWLSEKKIFGPAQGGYDNPLQAANELLFDTIASTADAVARGASGAFRGAQAAVFTGLGEGPFARDIAAIPEAFFGSPHPTGIPKGLPEGMPAGAAVLREVPIESRIAPSPPPTAPKFIEAYHGSPHDFDRFDISKIGTGEGAQSYGHGLYLAENERVATAYSKSTANQDFIRKARELYGEFDSTDDAKAAVAESKDFTPAQKHLLAALEKDDWLGFDYPHQAVSAALRAPDNFDLSPETREALGQVGNLYHVRINADANHFLDWDKPLSEQSDAVRAAIDKLFPGGKTSWGYELKTGQDVVRALGSEAVKGRPITADKPGASALLAEQGIPGIKYLDRGSRGTGKGTGTSNFVVFDDKSIEITHKNGEPVGAGSPDPGGAPLIDQARELGVIGPQKPPVTVGTPAEAAEREVPRASAAAARTGDDVLRGPEPSGPEKAGNIRLDQIGINQDAKEVILDAAKNNDDFNQARAGDVPLAQVESLAGASGVPSEVLSGNDGLGRLMHNDAVVRTWLQAFHQASDEIAGQLATVRATGDEAEIVKLREMKLRFQHMQEQVSGLTAEAGRTLRVFRDFYEQKGKAEGIGKLLEDHPGNDIDSLKKLADVAGTLDPRTQLPRFLHDANKPTWWDKYLYYWVNALISGPITHTKYIGANAAFGLYEAGVVTPIAGALGTARRAVTGTQEGVFMGEAAARTWGLLAGTPDALKAAWTAARENIMTPLPGEAASSKAVNPLTQLKVAPIGGKVGYALGIPGRSAAGIHTFFRFLGYRAEIEAQAYRAAAKEGLSPLDGEAFWQRRAALADQPSEAMIDAGVDNGNHLTFIGEQGSFGQAVSKLANTRMGPGGMQPFKLILPFTHIPGQILRAGLEQTPAAFLDTKMRADLLGQNGVVAADTARARLVAGGAVSAMVANWAVNDNITGYGPTDPSERARWLRSHEPYSVRLGGWWYSYNKFGPIGTLVGLVANLVEVGPKVEEGEYAEAAGHVIKATARMLEDEVGMQGLVNLIDALSEPDRKMGRFVAGQAASNLPYSSLLRQTASITDPYMREAKTFVDQLRYQVPYARQDLLPKRDWLGQPVQNPGYGSIIRQREVNTDPIDLEVAQLRGFKPSPPQPRIGGVALPPKMYDEYQDAAGAMTRVALERMVTAPGWGEMPPGIREQILHATVESMRKTAGAMTQARHPELIMQGLQDRQDKIQGVKKTKLKD